MKIRFSKSKTKTRVYSVWTVKQRDFMLLRGEVYPTHMGHRRILWMNNRTTLTYKTRKLAAEALLK